MKKSLITALVVAIGTIPAWAVDGADSYETLSEETIKTIDAFCSILSKIKDKKSADAVKQDFEDNARKMADLAKRGEKLGEPKAEKKEELEKKYKAKFDAGIKKLREEMNRIANNVDGGKEIVQELSKSLTPLAKKEKKN